MTPPGEMLLEEFLRLLGISQTAFAARLPAEGVRVAIATADVGA